MNRTVILGGIMISLIVFWLIGFVNTLHDDVEVSHGYNEKALATEKTMHTTINIYGDEVLLLNKLSLEEKKRLWNTSDLKIEMLELFPHFIKMKNFVETYVEDDGIFRKKLLSNIEYVEFEYVGGSFSEEKAKRFLSNF